MCGSTIAWLATFRTYWHNCWIPRHLAAGSLIDFSRTTRVWSRHQRFQSRGSRLGKRAYESGITKYYYYKFWHKFSFLPKFCHGFSEECAFPESRTPRFRLRVAFIFALSSTHRQIITNHHGWISTWMNNRDVGWTSQDVATGLADDYLLNTLLPPACLLLNTLS